MLRLCICMSFIKTLILDWHCVSWQLPEGETPPCGYRDIWSPLNDQISNWVAFATILFWPGKLAVEGLYGLVYNTALGSINIISIISISIISIDIIYIVTGYSRRVRASRVVYSGQVFPTGAVFHEDGFSGFEHAVCFFKLSYCKLPVVLYDMQWSHVSPGRGRVLSLGSESHTSSLFKAYDVCSWIYTSI